MLLFTSMLIWPEFSTRLHLMPKLIWKTKVKAREKFPIWASNTWLRRVEQIVGNVEASGSDVSSNLLSYTFPFPVKLVAQIERKCSEEVATLKRLACHWHDFHFNSTSPQCVEWVEGGCEASSTIQWVSVTHFMRFMLLSLAICTRMNAERMIAATNFHSSSDPAEDATLWILIQFVHQMRTPTKLF